MKFSDVAKLWAAYQPDAVNMTIHPKDVMYNSALKPEHYSYCGESGIEVISAALVAGPTLYVGDILDFGCGYGRVARFMRALFPSARMTFADVEEDAVAFCAKQFRGTALVTPKDVSRVVLPGMYDLIWLGSVFTHMDYDRMRVLFKILRAALKPNGLIVATFRGQKMYEAYKSQPAASERDAELIAQFEAAGVGYRRYPGWEDDWGLSLVKPAKLIEMGQEVPGTRMIMYSEVGWAAAHDVVAWTNRTPGTNIR